MCQSAIGVTHPHPTQQTVANCDHPLKKSLSAGLGGNKKRRTPLQKQKRTYDMTERLYITKAEDTGNLTVCLTFSDSTVQTVDIGDFIRRHPHPQYNKYLDPRKFNRFTIESGNIMWSKNWDLIFPVEQLHKGTIA